MTDLEIIEEYRSIEKARAELMKELNEVADKCIDKCTDLRNRVHKFRYGDGDIFRELDSMMNELGDVKANFSNVYDRTRYYVNDKKDEDEYI